MFSSKPKFEKGEQVGFSSSYAEINLVCDEAFYDPKYEPEYVIHIPNKTASGGTVIRVKERELRKL